MRTSIVFMLTILFLNGFLSAQEMMFKIEDKVSLSTVFIGNNSYIVSDRWEGIPLDLETGEDMNSSKYGGRFYPMYSDRSKGIIEKRTTIANGVIKIWMDVTNNSNSTYQLYSVEAFVLNEFELPDEYNVGQWVGYTPRLNEYSPKIYVSPKNIETNILTVDEPVLISPNKQNVTDNRFLIEIENDSDNPYRYRIIQFSLMFTLLDTRHPEKAFQLKSDRLFFLAFTNAN